MGERLSCTQEAAGSKPAGSTEYREGHAPFPPVEQSSPGPTHPRGRSHSLAPRGHVRFASEVFAAARLASNQKGRVQISPDAPVPRGGSEWLGTGSQRRLKWVRFPPATLLTREAQMDEHLSTNQEAESSSLSAGANHFVLDARRKGTGFRSQPLKVRVLPRTLRSC